MHTHTHTHTLFLFFTFLYVSMITNNNYNTLILSQACNSDSGLHVNVSQMQFWVNCCLKHTQKLLKLTIPIKSCYSYYNCFYNYNTNVTCSNYYTHLHNTHTPFWTVRAIFKICRISYMFMNRCDYRKVGITCKTHVKLDVPPYMTYPVGALNTQIILCSTHIPHTHYYIYTHTYASTHTHTHSHTASFTCTHVQTDRQTCRQTDTCTHKITHCMHTHIINWSLEIRMSECLSFILDTTYKQL